MSDTEHTAVLAALAAAEQQTPRFTDQVAAEALSQIQGLRAFAQAASDEELALTGFMVDSMLAPVAEKIAAIYCDITEQERRSAYEIMQSFKEG